MRFVFFLLLCYSNSIAQKSDLYLFSLLKSDTAYTIDQAQYLSDFNKDGYTNQPSFVSPDELLVTVGPAGDPVNTDIYKLNIATKDYTRLTQTVDREYSPTLMEDGEFMSCVVVEVDNDDNQVLWKYPYNLENGGQRVLRMVRNVGYYCFLDDAWVAIFEVDSVNRLTLFNQQTGESEFVGDNIGRTLKKGVDGSLLYVDKHSDDYWFIKSKKPGMKPDIVKKTIPQSEDFTVLPDGTILMGKESKLYSLTPSTDNRWIEVADLTDYGIGKITRLAFNGVDKLAVVEQK